MTTWLDVILIIPQYFDFTTGRFNNISKGRIIKFIERAQAYITTELRPFYSNLNIDTPRYFNECLLSNKNPDFVLNTSGISNVTKFTQVYSINFIAGSSGAVLTTTVNIVPDFETEVIGNISSSITLPKMTLGTGCWNSQTFNTGDIVYLATYTYEETLSTLCAKLAAAYILDATSNSQLSADGPNSQGLKAEVEKLLEKIKDPFAEMLEVSQKTHDDNPIAVHYDIDEFGNDNTEYNEE